MNIQKWKKAVVHLECAADSYNSESGFDEVAKALRDSQAGIISSEAYRQKFTEYSENSMSGSRDIRNHGTAIFLSHNDKYYLLTARHVVEDEREAKRVLARPHGQLISGAPEIISKIIFRIRSIDEVTKRPKVSTPFLMNLGVGLPDFTQFIFSEPNLDLAIISLNQSRMKFEFATNLLENGYEPITLNDIGSGPESEGKEVFTVGYPASTAFIGCLNLEKYQHSFETDTYTEGDSEHWASNYYSAPVFSYGRVSMRNDYLNFFWTDMSVYPGNSGSPVIADDKLIGIVIEQAMVPIDDSTEELEAGIPFGKAINAEYIFDLLNRQEEKDNNMASMFTPRPPTA